MTGSLLSLLLFALGLDSPTSRSPIDPKILELVAKLGDDNFRTREKSAQDLIQAGLVALPAVRGGSRSTNVELATRCEKLIPAIKEKYRETQLAHFLNRTDNKMPTGLPCVRRFLAITGDTPEARNLYAAMLREHPEIIESMEDSPEKTIKKLTKTVYEFRCRKELGENITLPNSRATPVLPLLQRPSEIALFFFVRPQHQSDVTREDLFDVSDELLTNNLISGPKSSAPLRKMFSHWFCNERRTQLLLLVASIVADEKMKEGIPNLIRCLKAVKNDKWQLAKLLLDLYTLGDRKNIPDIEYLLNDQDLLQEAIFSDEMDVEHFTTTLIGDVVLSICWLWSGKKLIDLNTAVKFHKDVEFNRNSYLCKCAFASEDDREAAIAKWKKVRAEMLEADEKQGKK